MTSYDGTEGQLDRETLAIGAAHAHAQMGESVQIEPSSPRVTSQLRHRANNPASSPLDYYRRNLVILVLDEVISEFDARFSKLSASAGQLVGLVSSVICERVFNVEEAAKLYTSDLPSPELLDQEADRWKRKFLAMEPESHPTSCASAIKHVTPGLSQTCLSC